MQTITRAFDAIFYQQKNHSLQKSFSYRPPGSNEWVSFSTDHMINQSQQLAGGLLNLGLQKGDKIALISYKNRPEWTMMEDAVKADGSKPELTPTMKLKRRVV